MTTKRDDEIARLKQMPDSEIDFSDIPETDAEFWVDAASWATLRK